VDEGRCPMQGHSLGCHRVSRDLEFTSFAKGCNVPCNVLLNDVKCKVEKWKSMTFLVMSVMSFLGGTCRRCWDDPRQPAWPPEVGDYGHWDAAGNSYEIYIYNM
jgi:hypothetical protein